MKIRIAEAINDPDHVEELLLGISEECSSGKERKLYLNLLSKIAPVIHKIAQAWNKENVVDTPQENTEAPNNPPVHYALECINNGGPLTRELEGGWEENQYDGTPQRVRLHISGHDSTFYASVEREGCTAPELWAVVKRFSALHSQVAAYCLTTLGNRSNKCAYPFQQAVTITVDDFLEAKDIEARGRDRRTLLKEIATCMQDLSELTIDVRNVLYKGKRVNFKKCKLFHVLEIQEAIIDINNPGESVPIEWKMQVGLWAEPYFSNAEADSLYWFDPSMKKGLLALDHRDNRPIETLAAKIGISLLTVSGGDRHRKATLEYKVSKVLDVCGLLLKEEHRGAHWASRTRETLEGALEELIKIKKLESYSFGPTYPDAGARGRGWVEAWLKATIYMTTPEAVAHMEGRPLLESKAGQPPKKALPPQKLPIDEGQILDLDTIAAIGKARLANNWTQEMLARELGVTQPQLSKVLGRARKASPEMSVKIKAFLSKPLRE